MYIRKLSLINFKNIPQADLELSGGINCFTGLNGAGKTNLIDAVYYLSMGRSSLTMTDSQSVRHGQEFFALSGDYNADEGSHEAVSCTFSRQAGKILKHNSKEYERLSDHIGVVPAVIVSPSDVYLISDAAEERRKWLNSFISQTDRTYLDALIRYNHVIAERNKLLKQPCSAGFDELVEVLDQRLEQHGQVIHRIRKYVIEKLYPVLAEYYRAISGDREQVELTYRSELNDKSFPQLLLESRQKDMLSQFTTAGIHRDDVVMGIGGYPLRKYGSQGQQKSFLIALKLAQHTVLTGLSGERPMLLLDDLFDKLDTARLEALISLVDDRRFGQILISDCNRERLTAILSRCGAGYTLYEIENGELHICAEANR